MCVIDTGDASGGDLKTLGSQSKWGIVTMCDSRTGNILKIINYKLNTYLYSFVLVFKLILVCKVTGSAENVPACDIIGYDIR